MSAPDSYTVEFDENGGYDCMYGGFDIKDASGKRVVTVDLGDFGQKPCGNISAEVKNAAAVVAYKIADALSGVRPENDAVKWMREVLADRDVRFALSSDEYTRGKEIVERSSATSRLSGESNG
jgi:hypothetical protein